MAGDRLARILTMLVGAGGVEPSPADLCRVCADATAMSGAGIMLMSNDTPRGHLGASDAVSTLIEDLQYTLGEGPCVDAYEHQRPVMEPNLGGAASTRWLAFTPPALDAGVGAVFGFPLQIGAIRLGALDLYREQPGPLSDDQHADALVVAAVAARAVLLLQANAPPGELAGELEASGTLQFVVHQASGMVSVQLGVSVGDALVRLRAYAFANDRALVGVAQDVVARRLRLDGDEKGGAVQ